MLRVARRHLHLRRALLVPQVGSLRFLSTQQDLPERSRVVVVGGGIIGSSIAYHIAQKPGFEGEVVLLEKDQLTSGTTWHAAGLMVTFGSLSETSTEMRKYTKQLYKDIEQETGQASGFKPVGFIELATSDDRLEEYRRVSAFNRKCGVDVHEISPAEVSELFPIADVSDVKAGFYVKDDGRVNPVDAAMALAKGARMRGARVIENVSVKDVLTEPYGSHGQRRVVGVLTECGRTIECEKVVNCAGMWARQLGERSGVCIPNQAAEHYYLITEPMDSVDPSWPVIEDPSSYAYIRPEAGGLMVGLFEAKAKAWQVNGIPQSFSFGEIEPDWDRMSPFLEKAMSRVPSTLETGAKKFFCGPESFSPDLSPVLGEAPEVTNYFVAAGMNSIGILSGGGIGRLMGDWVCDGHVDNMDITGMNIDRFQSYQLTPNYRRERVQEALGKVYACHYPHEPMETGRGAKHSPFRHALTPLGPSLREVSGWEIADWYAGEAVAERARANDPEARKLMEPGPFSFGRHHWFDHWKREHDACRDSVALFDMSFMSKFMVQGRDAGAFLNRLSTANVDEDSGVITYTQWLNERGRVEADLTVAKLDPHRYMVIATDTMHRHVEAWMRRQLKDDEFVTLTDVTGAVAQLNVQGPHSRFLLHSLLQDDDSSSNGDLDPSLHGYFSDHSFPFRAVRELNIGFAKVLASRITYVGELGYELFIPTEAATHVHERLTAKANELMSLQALNGAFQPRHAGLKALGSLRMEKGYRDYGHDVDNTDTVLQAGLGFTCDFDKPNGFIGKEAVLQQREELDGVKKLNKKLVQVLVKDPSPCMFHGEVLYRNGEVVGDIRAASYGHTLGGAVGLSMVETSTGQKEPVNAKYIKAGEWEVDIAGTRYPADVSLRPMYDPKNLKIKP